ncbi:hypothetical protein MVES1_003748 [Malassezia vespertilionis]|uniref:Uncharacterized protein n=1 Tax=Malassezia vespertilionis TaxID=2020962 RepID=A0A2N1J8F0_9BASI|nr:uncharacterized protein MVES1_003748 [Malassezia vespertilionis]PKI82841.1 hypothetical protein MVES_003306 [Malassezia vespertilionis]WFD08376.1 hypothetical protein MVES1_003748 [Malassezia vespertilionis]
MRTSRKARSKHVPTQQVSDLASTVNALEFERGRDVGQMLGTFAAQYRRVVEGLTLGMDTDEARSEVVRSARNVLLRKHTLQWPLLSTEAPAPAYLLSDEVAALAAHARPADIGPLWVDFQRILHHTLSHLSLLPPVSLSADFVEREAAKYLDAPDPTASVLEGALSYRPVAVQRRLQAHTIDWRDVLTSLFARVHTTSAGQVAMARTLDRMESLYAARPEEPHLVRKTWAMLASPDIHHRMNLLDTSKRRTLPADDPVSCLRDACGDMAPLPALPSAWRAWMPAEAIPAPLVELPRENAPGRLLEMLEWESDSESDENDMDTLDASDDAAPIRCLDTGKRKAASHFSLRKRTRRTPW